MPRTRAFRSKIGRLPHELRNELCERIRDGAQGVSILKWLNSTPEWKAARPDFGGKDVNAANLSEWRVTGYKDWLQNQADADQMRQLTATTSCPSPTAGEGPCARSCSGGSCARRTDRGGRPTSSATGCHPAERELVQYHATGNVVVPQVVHWIAEKVLASMAMPD